MVLKRINAGKIPFPRLDLHHIKTLSIMKTQQTALWVMMSRNLPYKMLYLVTSNTVLTFERQTANNKNINTNMNWHQYRNKYQKHSQNESILTPSTINYLNGCWDKQTNPLSNNITLKNFTVCVSLMCHYYQVGQKCIL